MKARYLCLLFAACAPHYVLELHAENTPPIAATVDTASSLSLAEGTALNTRIALRKDDELLKNLSEDDLILSTNAIGVLRVLPGPKALELAILGLSAGSATIEVRYKGKLVDTKTVTVTAQPR